MNKLNHAIFASTLGFGLMACGGDDTNNNGNDAGVSKNAITGDVTDLTGRGDWGGLVLSGRGLTNSGDTNGELLTEAAPQDQERWYGGASASDSSGSVKYAIIAESGFEFRPDQEVQGLTVEAAGSGTSIDYVQVLGSEDDCVEWFGGAAGTKHLVCLGADDDYMDQDLGFTGMIQYVLVRIGSSNGDFGMETDNNGDNFDAAPQTSPKMANVTILGNSGKMGKAPYGALHREGWRGQVYRSVYTDDMLGGTQFVAGCLNIDDSLPAELMYRDAVFNCSPGPLVDDEDTGATNKSFQQDAVDSGQVEWFDGAGLTVKPTLAVDLTTATAQIPAPVTALPAGFENANYHGAVDPAAATGWWQGWTYINSGVDGNLPGADFHPLQAEIEDGTIAPASENACATVSSSFKNGGVVTVFGKEFPVCLIEGRIMANATLPNSHVFVFNGTVNVGDGDRKLEGASPASVKLTVQGGTQLFAAAGTASSIVITRGSQIDVQGTADLPVIMGAVDMDLSGL